MVESAGCYPFFSSCLIEQLENPFAVLKLDGMGMKRGEDTGSLGAKGILPGRIAAQETQQTAILHRGYPEAALGKGEQAGQRGGGIKARDQPLSPAVLRQQQLLGLRDPLWGKGEDLNKKQPLSACKLKQELPPGFPAEDGNSIFGHGGRQGRALLPAAF